MLSRCEALLSRVLAVLDNKKRYAYMCIYVQFISNATKLHFRNAPRCICVQLISKARKLHFENAPRLIFKMHLGVFPNTQRCILKMHLEAFLKCISSCKFEGPSCNSRQTQFAKHWVLEVVSFKTHFESPSCIFLEMQFENAEVQICFATCNSFKLRCILGSKGLSVYN